MILIIILAISTKGNMGEYKMSVVIALMICAIGDYTLQWFIIGLSSFLIGHLFYIRAFLKTKNANVPYFIKLAFVLYGGLMMFWIGGSVLLSGENVLAVAVVIYMLVILIMGWTSFRTSSKFTIAGAVLFILSDTILAINKFVFSVPLSHQLIMLTYYGAQLLMALSIANYFAFRSNDDTMEAS